MGVHVSSRVWALENWFQYSPVMLQHRQVWYPPSPPAAGMRTDPWVIRVEELALPFSGCSNSREQAVCWRCWRGHRWVSHEVTRIGELALHPLVAVWWHEQWKDVLPLSLVTCSRWESRYCPLPDATLGRADGHSAHLSLLFLLLGLFYQILE